MINKVLKISAIGLVMLCIPLAKADILSTITNLSDFLGKKGKQKVSNQVIAPKPVTQTNTLPKSADQPATKTVTHFHAATASMATKAKIDAVEAVHATVNLQPRDFRGSFDINTVAAKLSAEAETLDPKIVKMGLEAYLKAKSQGFAREQILTIVDYNQPSTQPRLYVFDLKTNNLLFKELVAHGKNSGGNHPNSFSNAPSSLKSSLGVFVTSKAYVGQHGISLRINGLEKGINDMAASRAIVVHAANYVSHAFARAHGRLGKSWGCFAVDPNIASSLIKTIKGGSVIFAYYPDQHYLAHSNYLM